MAYTFRKKWQHQHLAQYIAAESFAGDVDVLDIDVPENHIPVCSINDIFETKCHLTMSLLTLEDPEQECPETTNFFSTLISGLISDEFKK